MRGALLGVALAACSADSGSADTASSFDTSLSPTPEPTVEPPRPDCSTENEDCGPGDCRGPEGSDMLPGADCVACHSSGGDPELGSSKYWSIGGTVFAGPLGTQPQVGATIRLTDASGDVWEFVSNSVGNFYTPSDVKKPYNAEIEVDGQIIAMVAEQENGGCNSCHACEGAAGGKLHGP